MTMVDPYRIPEESVSADGAPFPVSAWRLLTRMRPDGRVTAEIIDNLGGLVGLVTSSSGEILSIAGVVAVGASPYAAHAVVDTWLTDFRDDLPRIDVPTLVIHGDADRILPYEATAARLPGLIKDLEFVTVEDGPHNIAWTHPDELNSALLAFLAK
jgi:pimeloyl-ACP methyl ester carboxylesterase